MDKIKVNRWRRMSLRVVSAIGISIALSGCIVEPLYGPHYYRPYHGYGYGYGY
jgi:hypothetical protein